MLPNIKIMSALLLVVNYCYLAFAFQDPIISSKIREYISKVAYSNLILAYTDQSHRAFQRYWCSINDVFLNVLTKEVSLVFPEVYRSWKVFKSHKMIHCNIHIFLTLDSFLYIMLRKFCSLNPTKQTGTGTS